MQFYTIALRLTILLFVFMLLLLDSTQVKATSWTDLRTVICSPSGILEAYELQLDDAGCSTPFLHDACLKSRAKPRKFCEPSGRIDDIEYACSLGNNPQQLIVQAYEAAEQHIRREVYFCHCSTIKSPYCHITDLYVGNQKACELVVVPLSPLLSREHILDYYNLDDARNYVVGEALRTATTPVQHNWYWVTSFLFNKTLDNTPCD